ncbi:MAG: hypothetical protein IJ812_04610 [Schwartzia sp.]|nr:hypothetical protein [Schwartzia sp. (in: firmicutes)]
MNYTENYSLPQWEDTDVVTREDVNGAMSRIDAALAAAGGGNCKIVYGMYLGQNSNVVSIDFDSNPVAIIVYPRRKPSTVANQTLIAVRDAFWAPIAQASSVTAVSLTWRDDYVLWSGTDAAGSLNAENTEYIYAALLATDE